MKLLKKFLVSSLAIAISVSAVACAPSKKTTEKQSETKTEKTEYITKITKDNVEQVVIEYKEILSYYNDLKNNLKTLSDVSNNSNLESDAIAAKDSIKNGTTLLASVKPKYKSLEDAKKILVDMYDVSETMAEDVVSNPDKYKKDLEEYDKHFKKFKDLMDEIRKDVEKVRGKSPKTEDQKDDLVTEVAEKDNKDKDKDKKDSDNSSDNKSNDKDRDNDSNSRSGSDRGRNSGDSSSTSRTKPGNSSSSGSNDSQGFVPKVSSLNNSIRNEIKSAGYSAGANFKQSGGSEAQIEQTAGQLFDDLEGDNPIQGSQVSEARAIFISAFRAAYYSR